MADAKTRAAARRQAILAGKSDRLAKLTTKAKNEGDAAGSVRDPNDDPPLAKLPSDSYNRSTGPQTRSQVTSRTPNRTPQHSSSMTPERSDLGTTGGVEDALGWDPTQKEHFMRALMASHSREGTPQLSGFTPQRGASPFPNIPDPFLAMTPPPERPKTLLEKLLPLLHATSTILFLLFFVARTGSDSVTMDNVLSTDYWRRWGDLATSPPSFGWSGEHQDVLYTFLSLQIALHSIRIFIQASPPKVPMLLGLVLPHLPPPLPMAIQTGMRYLQMGGLLLDDFSVLVVGIGIVIFAARWYTTF